MTVEIPESKCPHCAAPCQFEDGVFACTACFWTEDEVVRSVHSTQKELVSE